jgi:uncharacterized membrane protein
MSDLADTPNVRRRALMLSFVCIVLGAAMLWFVSQKLHYLTDYTVASYSDYFWGRRVGLLAHLLGGMTAAGVGVIQIWLGLTDRAGRLHRMLGRCYVAAVSLGCPAGMYLALTIPQHFAYASGLFFLAVAWAVTTGMAVLAIRSGQVQQHRDWMLRSYTVTFAFVMFRLADPFLHAVIPAQDVPGDDDINAMAAWASWSLPLLAIEVWIQSQAMRRR